MWKIQSALCIFYRPLSQGAANPAECLRFWQILRQRDVNGAARQGAPIALIDQTIAARYRLGSHLVGYAYVTFKWSSLSCHSWPFRSA
ncbi:MAG: hypothetical protein ACJAYH_000401 [Celeribacter sp.]|jgi:hypothetical protein